MAGLRAGKHNVLAIRKEAGAATVNQIMRDLLGLPYAEGNQKKLARNAQGERRQHPFHVRREIVANAIAYPYGRRAIACAHKNVVIRPATSPSPFNSSRPSGEIDITSLQF